MERYSTGRVRADGSDGSAPTKGAGGAAQHPAAIAASGKANRVLIHCRDDDRNRATAVDLAPRWGMLLSALPDAFRQVAQATRALVTTSPGLDGECPSMQPAWAARDGLLRSAEELWRFGQRFRRQAKQGNCPSEPDQVRD